MQLEAPFQLRRFVALPPSDVQTVARRSLYLRSVFTALLPGREFGQREHLFRYSHAAVPGCFGTLGVGDEGGQRLRAAVRGHNGGPRHCAEAVLSCWPIAGRNRRLSICSQGDCFGACRKRGDRGYLRDLCNMDCRIRTRLFHTSRAACPGDLIGPSICRLDRSFQPSFFNYSARHHLHSWRLQTRSAAGYCHVLRLVRFCGVVCASTKRLWLSFAPSSWRRSF